MEMTGGDQKIVQRGYRTEYGDNYQWGPAMDSAGSWNKAATGLFDGVPDTGKVYPIGGSVLDPSNQAMMGSFPPQTIGVADGMPGTMGSLGGTRTQTLQDLPNTEFQSALYPSVYRETVVHKDERGHYIDPFRGLASKPYGRRLMYDPSHYNKMYASQWSSELADAPGPYSFPTTTGLEALIPWTKDMSWRSEGEEGAWPTEQWKEWTRVAECPPYDGHDDQAEYHKYKVQVA